MAFDPLDSTTWHDDPDDFIVPLHEIASVAATAKHIYTVHDNEEAEVRAFLGLDRWCVDEDAKEEALQQVMESRQAIHDALQKLQDAEEAADAQAELDAEREEPPRDCPNCGGELINPADWLHDEEES